MRGVNDTTIRWYAVEHDRVIITSDDDFVRMPTDSHSGVFYVPDQSLTPQELYHIIQRVVEAFPDREAMETVTFVTADWLDSLLPGRDRVHRSVLDRRGVAV
ncbi:DUF5615 family PIN-like protein [Halorubrum sp. GN11_10-6_MGM]|uniref:DUF5615 family PIN-like protein n=1 Tax=Halorubrum sp. GN11_10-6_MGM TaxID=2518112 RepID=UPI001F543233|nr:DUF5615 family PIN-like protein [Halorubrum sp. GN11_10-6_MGM]